MTTIKADEVRIPRHIREAVSRHERIVVLNRERPVLAMVHPDDVTGATTQPRGRSVGEIAAALAVAPTPDVDFVKDMDAILRGIGGVVDDPWEQS